MGWELPIGLWLLPLTYAINLWLKVWLVVQVPSEGHLVVQWVFPLTVGSCQRTERDGKGTRIRDSFVQPTQGDRSDLGYK